MQGAVCNVQNAMHSATGGVFFLLEGTVRNTASTQNIINFCRILFIISLHPYKIINFLQNKNIIKIIIIFFYKQGLTALLGRAMV